MYHSIFPRCANSCCKADSGLFCEPCQPLSTLAARICFHVVPMGVVTVHQFCTDICHLPLRPSHMGYPGARCASHVQNVTFSRQTSYFARVCLSALQCTISAQRPSCYHAFSRMVTPLLIIKQAAAVAAAPTHTTGSQCRLSRHPYIANTLTCIHPRRMTFTMSTLCSLN